MLVVHCLQKLKFRFDLSGEWKADTWEKELEDMFVLRKGKLPTVVEARG